LFPVNAEFEVVCKVITKTMETTMQKTTTPIFFFDIYVIFECIHYMQIFTF